MLGNVVSHHVAQRIGLSAAATKNSLLTPLPAIGRRLSQHLTCSAPRSLQQPVQEQPFRGDTRSRVNRGRMPAFISSSVGVQRFNVVSIELPTFNNGNAASKRFEEHSNSEM